MLGQVVGNYLITDVIGEGGMGSVYLGEHRLIGREAAIKLLREDLSHDQSVVNRFFNEARASTAVKHPGIVEVFDFGVHGDRAFIVMELLEGETLHERIEREAVLSEARAVQIARQVLGALGAAHEAGIVHRDLKPDNIFLVNDPDVTGGERTKILDFGIAKLTAHQQPGAFRTQTGQIMGTPAYMSPEQCKGLPEIDARSDLYSLGCILYHMLTGAPPFTGRGAGEVLGAHMHVQPLPLRKREPSVSRPVEIVVMRLLAKEPGQRYSTCAQVLQAFETTASDERDATADTAPPRWMKPTQPSADHRTTLSSASSVSRVEPAPERKRSLWGLWVAGAAVAVAAGVAIAVTLGSDGSPEPSASSPVSEQSDSDEAPEPPEPAPEATSGGPDDSDRQPPEPLGLPEVSVSIFSEPAGAEVYRKADFTRVGVTPFEGTFTARNGGEHVFVLKLAGYEDSEVVVSAETGGRETVELEKLETGSSKSARRDSKKKHRKKKRETDRTGTADSSSGSKTTRNKTTTTKKKKKKKRELDDDEINPFRP